MNFIMGVIESRVIVEGLTWGLDCFGSSTKWLISEGLEMLLVKGGVFALLRPFSMGYIWLTLFHSPSFVRFHKDIMLLLELTTTKVAF